MKNVLILTALALSLAACAEAKSEAQAQQDASAAQPATKTRPQANPQANPQARQSVTFQATDGGTVYADVIRSGQAEAPLIILFHQAGSNGRGEYANIFPRLVDNGYDVLLVDQRSGGSYYGSENRTVKARGSSTKYCAAYPDLEGALRYAKTLRPEGPIFAWGSSYSAALVLKLAGNHGDDLAGVLAFSPATGRAMGPCNANNFIKGVQIPALGMKPAREMDATGQAQQQAFSAQGLDYYVAKDGVHGSSMLDPARTHKNVEPTWARTLAFLKTHA